MHALFKSDNLWGVNTSLVVGETNTLYELVLTLMWMLIPTNVSSVVYQLAVLELNKTALALEKTIARHKLFERVSKATFFPMTTGLVLFYTIAHACLC
jgi:hypothetical protein